MTTGQVKLDATFQRARDTLARIDAHIDDLVEQLKAAQPKLPGALLLERHDCGSGCVGCPHPRWKIWRADNRHNPPRWYASNLRTNPVQSLKRSGPFEEKYEVAKHIVAELQDSLRTRMALTESVAAVGRLLSQRRIG
jgi:hypothetical protein